MTTPTQRATTWEEELEAPIKTNSQLNGLICENCNQQTMIDRCVGCGAPQCCFKCCAVNFLLSPENNQEEWQGSVEEIAAQIHIQTSGRNIPGHDAFQTIDETGIQIAAQALAERIKRLLASELALQATKLREGIKEELKWNAEHAGMNESYDLGWEECKTKTLIAIKEALKP